jgi:hypothetical protein
MRGAIVMFKGFAFGVLAIIVIALVGGYFVLRNGIIPANADTAPGWLEIWAAGTSLDATLRREAPGTNPIPLTDENLIAAIKLSTVLSATVRRRETPQLRRSRRAYIPGPHNWRQTAWKTIPKDSPFGRSSTAPAGPMPSWKGTLADQQIWSLALFLKHMDKLPPAAEQAWQNVVN